MASLAPFVLLLVSNIVLVRAVLTSARNVRHKLAVGQSMQVATRENQASSLSVTLIALSVTFFFLTGPLRVYLIGYPYFNFDEAKIDKYINILIFLVLYILFGANAVVNFFLYCLTGTKFRREVMRLLCSFGLHKSNEPKTSHYSS